MFSAYLPTVVLVGMMEGLTIATLEQANRGVVDDASGAMRSECWSSPVSPPIEPRRSSVGAAMVADHGVNPGHDTGPDAVRSTML